ncbi:MAG: hypothetical protein AB8H79_22745 [Myxococcota bacterium]
MTTQVHKDSSRTLMFAVCLVLIGLLGTTIAGLSYFFEWGFCGYSIGGVCLLAGFGGLGSMFAGGGAWKADCPNCGKEVKWTSGDPTFIQDKTVCCTHCKTWMHGNAEFTIIEAGYVHPEPIFPATVGDSLRWPPGCPTCGEPTTRTVKVEGRSALGSAAIALGGGGVQRVWVVQAPACAEHDDGVWALREGETGDELWFRNFSYRQAFVDLNPPEAEAQP